MDLSIDWNNFQYLLMILMGLCSIMLMAWGFKKQLICKIAMILIILDMLVIGFILGVLFLNFIVQLFLKV